MFKILVSSKEDCFNYTTYIFDMFFVRNINLYILDLHRINIRDKGLICSKLVPGTPYHEGTLYW